MFAYPRQAWWCVGKTKRRSFLFVQLFCLISALAQAGIGPDSRIPPAVPLNPSPIGPPPRFTYTVYLESPLGAPLVNAEVKLVLPPEAWDLLIFCGSPHEPLVSHEFTTYTNLLGEATFSPIFGGGCWPMDNVDMTLLISVVVEGEIVAHVGTASIDVIDKNAKKAWQAWCQAPRDAAGCTWVELADAVYWTPEMKLGRRNLCSDMDGDGKAGISEAVALTIGIKLGQTCSEN